MLFRDRPFQDTHLRPLRFAAICLSSLIFLTSAAHAVTCKVASAHVNSPAQQAFLRGDYEEAVSLYRTEISRAPAGGPQRAQLTADLVRILLYQQKVAEAAAVIEPAVVSDPHSAPLDAALAAVQYRQGLPWKASRSATAAVTDDPCYARGHLILAKLFRLESLYSSEQHDIQAAYQLDPLDTEVRRAWILSLPLKDRVSSLKSYLVADTGEEARTRQNQQIYLENLETYLNGPRKDCRLVSSTASTEIPFTAFMSSATRIRAFGLDVKLNDKSSRLEINTDTYGIFVNRSVAERVGLKPLFPASSNSASDPEKQSGYTAYADSIRIGGLEFHNCVVRVRDRKVLGDFDGLIGMDVFSRFLVGLDYPMRKLTLSPLPRLPEDATTETPTLRTDGAPESQSAATPAVNAPGPPNTAAASRSAYSSLRNRYIAPEMKDYIPVYRVDQELLVPTSLNGGPNQLFLLDTGAWSTTVSPDSARSVTNLRSNDRVLVRSNGKATPVYSADRVVFQFAALRQEVDNVSTFDTVPASRNAGLDIAGFLGFSTLRLLTIHIDYRDGLVKFDYDSQRGFNPTSALNP
ncbi:MAG: hypothetical protein QOH35_1016 [Acidobacteriaceae bacterium]|nr:hypothetical protein [Acidobacteriaceae bacterium]